MRMWFTEPVNIRDPGIVVALGGRAEYIRIDLARYLQILMLYVLHCRSKVQTVLSHAWAV